MTAHDRFFQRKQAAAVLKHGILKRYPTVFASKTGSQAAAGRVVYLDGYAGPGRYEPEDGQTEGAEGSPLLAVHTAATVEKFRRELHCVFVERDPQHVVDLRDMLMREAPASMSYEVLEGDVSEHLQHVLDTAARSPLLAFLDPFGTGLPYADMAGRLLRSPRNPPTEVLLNFNLQAVWRIGGWLTGEDTEAPRGGREPSLARIDAFLGDDWWRETFRAAHARGHRETGVAVDAALEVMRAFCARITADTGYHAFTVPIRREPGHAPLFVMILFYRHRVAPFVFNEAASGANEDWRTFHYELELEQQRQQEQRAPDLFGGTLVPELLIEDNARTETQLHQDWVSTIAGNIADLTAARGQISVQEHITAIYGRTLGLARSKHLTRAWDHLSDQHQVRPRLKGKVNRLENQIIYRA
jgi:three-Cys-motif partner protein